MLDEFTRRLLLRMIEGIDADWGPGDIAHFLIWQRLPDVDVRTLTDEEWDHFLALGAEWLEWAGVAS